MSRRTRTTFRFPSTGRDSITASDVSSSVQCNTCNAGLSDGIIFISVTVSPRARNTVSCHDFEPVEQVFVIRPQNSESWHISCALQNGGRSRYRDYVPRTCIGNGSARVIAWQSAKRRQKASSSCRSVRRRKKRRGFQLRSSRRRSRITMIADRYFWISVSPRISRDAPICWRVLPCTLLRRRRVGSRSCHEADRSRFIAFADFRSVAPR